MLLLSKTFAAQVTVGSFLTDFFYIFATTGNFLAMVGLVFLDGGLVKQKHLLDTLMQKIISAFIAGVAFMVVGYGIWNWQFNQALSVSNALLQSISDWSIFGPNLRIYAQSLDSAVVPNADTQQIFVAFFFCYAGLVGAFIHSMGIERMKPGACYILSAIAGGLVMPVLAYLTWGPVGPLTNLGLHDFVGAYSLYMLIGVWSLILSWRLGVRRLPATPFNGVMVASGSIVLMVAIPMFAVGCGFLKPGSGYYGINNTHSGLGITFLNVYLAFGGGALSGALIAYRKQDPISGFLGPVAGYVACSALLDIAAPWQCFLLGLAGPFIRLLGGFLLARLKIDDQKLVPLALGPSIFSALIAGVVGAGLPSGGLEGLTGAYAFQHARISLSTQALGVATTLAIAAISGLASVFIVEKTLGLRVESAAEDLGLDMCYWAIADGESSKHQGIAFRKGIGESGFKGKLP